MLSEDLPINPCHFCAELEANTKQFEIEDKEARIAELEATLARVRAALIEVRVSSFSKVQDAADHIDAALAGTPKG